MSRNKSFYFIALLIICIIGLFQLTTLSFRSLFLGGSHSKTQTTTTLPRGRIVNHDKSVIYGPRFTNTDKTPSIGPKKKLKIVNNLRIIKDGELVEGVKTTDPIYVDADNVVIRDFTAPAVIQQPGHTGMLLEDGVIDGANTDFDGIRWNHFTARRVEIRNVVDGVKAHGNVLLEDVWVHDLTTYLPNGKTLHNDCVQISSGSDITIRYSRLERCGNNAAIFIKSDEGSINNVLVENNILASGNYTFQALTSPVHPGVTPENITLSHNFFISEANYGPLNINVAVKFIGNINDKGKTIAH